MHVSRRGFLAGSGAALAALNAPLAFGETALNWSPAYMSAPAEGYGPTSMTRLHGKLPEGFAGQLYRNGPAQFQYGDSYLSHWFDGDGMVHSIRFADDQATHSARFVETSKRTAEQAAQRFVAPGFGSIGDASYPVDGPDSANAANTSVIRVGDELLALWEAGSAFRLDPVTLETLGPKAWRDDLAGMPFLAHPKVQPDGTIWNLAVSGRRVGIYCILPTGDLKSFDLVDMETPSYIHDFAMTERHIILLVQPWLYTRNIPPFTNSFSWEPERGLRALIIDKADISNQRWAELPPRFFFHTGDAWETADGSICLDICTYQDASFAMEGEHGLFSGDYKPHQTASASLELAVIPMKGEAKFLKTGFGAEFPRIDPRYQGQDRNQVWTVDTTSRDYAPGAQKIRRFDWQRGEADSYDYGREHMVEEHIFVPRPGSEKEGDGWLLGTTLNMKEAATEVHIFDAMSLKSGPLASYRAPYAWPLGFHGTWSQA